MAMAGTPGSVADAIDLTQVWNDTGTGAKMDGSVWRASVPDGYESLGDMWVKGYGRPDPKSMYAVNKECVVPCTQTPQLIYSGTAKMLLT